MKPKERPGPTYHCPYCQDEIRHLPGCNEYVVCTRCQRRYMVMIDQQTGTVAFVDQAQQRGSEPLWLPRGSIRAVVALALAAGAVAVAAQGRPMPSQLMSLLLTVVGFYYGFRTKACELGDRLYDPTAVREQPLHLPSGVIRTLIILCLCLAGGLLLTAGKMTAANGQVGFFIILAGLVIGHYFAKFIRLTGGGKGPMGHVKALVVLAITAALVYMFVVDSYVFEPRVINALCGAVSFYFGTRS